MVSVSVGSDPEAGAATSIMHRCSEAVEKAEETTCLAFF
jgi:hypothetical protein